MVLPSAVGMEAVVSLWKGVLQRLDVGSHKNTQNRDSIPARLKLLDDDLPTGPQDKRAVVRCQSCSLLQAAGIVKTE